MGYWWPRFGIDITNYIRSCNECRPLLISQEQLPIINQNNAKRPMETFGVDLFQIGTNYYLAGVDQYSGYLFRARLRSTNTATVLRRLREWFSEYGNPDRLILDNGVQLSSMEFDQFCQERGIVPQPGSIYYPQANGLSESAVKQVKYLLIKCKEDWD